MAEKLSVIVPCYNEQDALPLFCRELIKVLRKTGWNYEVLLVDDGSSDQTLDVMKKLSEADSHLHYISFSRNFGKESAMYAGFRNVDGDYVAVMDADMQHPPTVLAEMMHIIQTEECDCVAARREDRNGENAVRNCFSSLFYKIINKTSDTKIIDSATDFRIMKRQMANAVKSMAECDRFSKGLFSWVGFRTRWISYPNAARVAGEPKWSFRRLADYALGGIVNFSYAPLNAVLWIGSAVTATSFAALVIAVIQILANKGDEHRWIIAVCILALLGGIILVSLGIMGQYMIRIFREVKRRPHYIVAETDIGDEASTGDSDQSGFNRPADHLMK